MGSCVTTPVHKQHPGAVRYLQLSANNAKCLTLLGTHTYLAVYTTQIRGAVGSLLGGARGALDRTQGDHRAHGRSDRTVHKRRYVRPYSCRKDLFRLEDRGDAQIPRHTTQSIQTIWHERKHDTCRL